MVFGGVCSSFWRVLCVVGSGLVQAPLRGRRGRCARPARVPACQRLVSPPGSDGPEGPLGGVETVPKGVPSGHWSRCHESAPCAPGPGAAHPGPAQAGPSPPARPPEPAIYRRGHGPSVDPGSTPRQRGRSAGIRLCPQTRPFPRQRGPGTAFVGGARGPVIAPESVVRCGSAEAPRLRPERPPTNFEFRPP